MAVTLDDAWDKLRWAKQHFETLRPQAEHHQQRRSRPARALATPISRLYRLVGKVSGAIATLGLENIAFVVHDWGSALAFHHARRNERNVRALAFMEAILMPIPSLDSFPAEARDLFTAFRTPDVGWDLIARQNVFVEQLLPGSVVRGLTDAEMEHYRKPYPDEASRKPVWRWPNEIPLAGERADMVVAVSAYNQWLQQTELPKLLFHASPGAIITPPVLDWAKTHLTNLQTVDLGQGIHYLQEDHPHTIGRELAGWLESL